ncbi:MAG: ATP synthase F1 subunit epsilon [Candidatus Gottesmanbacteria bacterium]
MHLTIVTPQREALSQDVNFVTVPTPTGTIGILPKHIPLVTALVEGEIKVLSGEKESYFAIGGGFMQVTKKSVIILVSRAVHADELNEAEIKKAHETARTTVKQKGAGIERAEAQAMLRRSFLELKVLRHKRRRSGTPDSL